MKRRQPGGRKLADVVRISSAELRRDEPSHERDVAVTPAQSQAICVASGKGGTGKTIFSTNMGILLARRGLKVTLIDADLGLANSHLLLGLDPAHDISQLINGERHVDEVLVEGPHGLRILPGGSGIAELAELNEGQLGYFANQMARVDEESDVILIDCAAGINQQVLRFMASAHEVVVVTTPEVTSMIDGYAVIKNMHQHRPDMPIWLVVNRTKTPDDEREVFQKMRSIAAKRLGNIRMRLLGSLPHDRYIARSIAQRQPVTTLHPRSFATSSFVRMSTLLADGHRRWCRNQGAAAEPDPSYFWSLSRRLHG